MAQFRFEDLEIWEKAIKIGDRLYEVASRLEQENKLRFAEQLRGAALSISNNIAEGSGSGSDTEFKRYLGIARKSVYEIVNMLKVFERRELISSETMESLVEELDGLSRSIHAFGESLE